MAEKERLEIKIEKEDLEKLKQAALKQGVSIAEIVRQAIKHYWKTYGN